MRFAASSRICGLRVLPHRASTSAGRFFAVYSTTLSASKNTTRTQLASFRREKEPPGRDDFLSRFVVRLDLERKVMTLFDPEHAPEPHGEAFPMDLDHFVPRIEAMVDDSIPARFQLDTGAPATAVFFRSFWTSHGLLPAGRPARVVETAGLAAKEALVERLARTAAAAYPGARVDVAVTEQYRNMREALCLHPEVIAHAREAIRRAGLTPRSTPIRGGTDGSRLSFMGLPTPNLFAGEHNFHSRLEWVSAQDMEDAVRVIVELCRVWEEKQSPVASHQSPVDNRTW